MSGKKKTNGHSKPEDFLLPEYPEIEDATLPSGLKVKLRPPIGMEFWARVGDLPGTLSAAGKEKQEATPEEIIDWSYRTVCALIVEPVFSRDPQPGEFHPRRLQPQDRLWLRQYYQRWLSGGGGAALESFRGQAGEPGGSGQSGEAVQQGSK